MVSSGLDKEHLAARPNSTPRVSQYRLAAHLGTAFVLYLGMIHTALSISRDWAYAHGLKVGGEKAGAGKLDEMLIRGGARLARFRTGVWAVGGLVLLTALSGAFVAGLDAGLVYNEWPTMGDGYIPPTAELMDDAYARKADKSDAWWRNLLENPTTVQFDHRMLVRAPLSCLSSPSRSISFADTALAPSSSAGLHDSDLGLRHDGSLPLARPPPARLPTGPQARLARLGRRLPPSDPRHHHPHLRRPDAAGREPSGRERPASDGNGGTCGQSEEAVGRGEAGQGGAGRSAGIEDVTALIERRCTTLCAPVGRAG